MRSVAVLPALALVTGAAVGVESSVTAHVPLLVGPSALLVAVVGWACRAPRTTLVALFAGFFATSVAIAADARDRALHSSLRAALDAAFGGFSIDSIGPEGPHDPLLLRTVLLQDAAVADDVVSLRARAVALRLRGVWVPVDGGVTLSVAGAGARAGAIAWTHSTSIDASFAQPESGEGKFVPPRWSILVNEGGSGMPNC